MNMATPAHWVATFLHEYIHFLQDITTTHGLLNFLHAIEHLKNANKQVIENPAAVFQIPLRISNDYNWETNRKLRRLYNGCDDPVEGIVYSGYRVDTEQIIAGDGSVILVPKYLVDYYDNGAQTNMTCHFGSIHIKEYMAHAVQKQFAPATSHAAIPYCLAELIVQKEIPRLAGDVSFIIALCDASLMDFHPARLFFHTIERIKSTPDWTPEDADSVYTLAFWGCKLSYDGRVETFESLYDRTAESAVLAFHDSLPAGVYNNNVLWFKEVIAGAQSLRSNHRAFFSHLVASPGKLSATFDYVMTAVGIPYTTNELSKGYFVAPAKLMSCAIQPYYPKAFQAICRTYMGHRDCALYPFCEARTAGKIINDDCWNQPWARVEQPELCPYAQMWKAWGLQGKTPSKA
jgi:hypothetical protein